MARLTERAPDGTPVLTGSEAAALEKLARFEDLCDALAAQQETLARELEDLRQAGKKSSVKFREQMGKKLMNSHMLTTFSLHELD